MHAKYTALTDPLYDYLVAHNPAPDPVLRDLAAETAALGPVSMMQIAVEQGAFLTLLTQLLNVRFAVEIGTFTGYSSISIARGLRDGGRLLCCDINDDWTQIARRYWERAGLTDRITLKLGPALDTLRGLPAAPPIDLAFIDADKPNYRHYYEELLPRLRQNGVILFDNVLWMGAVAEPTNQEESTKAIRELNDLLTADPRVDTCMLPIADGLTMARKR